MPKLYKLRYLPLFWEDLSEAAGHIAFELGNPGAAERLIDGVEAGILERQANPTMVPTYHTTRMRPHPYHYFPVGNYRVFYVVLDDVMEVRRLLYRGRNLDELIC